MHVRSPRRAGRAGRSLAALAALAVSCGIFAGACGSAGRPALPAPLTAAPPAVAGPDEPAVAPTGEPTAAAVVPLPTPLPEAVSYGDALPLFEYDRSLPFAIRGAAASRHGTTTVRDITYLGATGVLLPAYLVVPDGAGPFPGVVWMGWTGGSAQIREEFVAEALNLAGRGVASILVAGYFPWFVPPKDEDADRMAMIAQVRELRRAVDLLVAQPGVDAGRIGFVGHSMGAMHGATLAAVDHRIRAAVLMTPNSNVADWIFSGYPVDPATEPVYRARMASFDPLAFVAHAAPTALFFQFGVADPHVTTLAAVQLFGAASEPKRIGWYGGGHDLDARAEAERDGWLADELGLPTVSRSGPAGRAGNPDPA